MTHCRMCSQRLTHSGRLCRECERELERARVSGVPVDDVAAIPLIDASRMAGPSIGSGVVNRLRARAPIVAVAFAVGIVGAAALHVAQRSSASVTPGSVMLDRDISGVRPRSFISVGGGPVGGTIPNALRSPSSGVAADSGNMGNRANASTVASVTLPVQATPTAEVKTRQGAGRERRSPVLTEPAHREVVATAPAASPPSPVGERLGLLAALARCADGRYFARPDCEARARVRYCGNAGVDVPECADNTVRERGQ